MGCMSEDMGGEKGVRGVKNGGRRVEGWGKGEKEGRIVKVPPLIISIVMLKENQPRLSLQICKPLTLFILDTLRVPLHPFLPSYFNLPSFPPFLLYPYIISSLPSLTFLPSLHSYFTLPSFPPFLLHPSILSSLPTSPFHPFLPSYFTLPYFPPFLI